MAETTVQIRVVTFAALAAKLGWKQRDMAVACDATVGQVMEQIGMPMSGIVPAVNDEYVKLDCPLKDGDEVALIPPVSGG